ACRVGRDHRAQVRGEVNALIDQVGNRGYSQGRHRVGDSQAARYRVGVINADDPVSVIGIAAVPPGVGGSGVDHRVGAAPVHGKAETADLHRAADVVRLEPVEVRRVIIAGDVEVAGQVPGAAGIDIFLDAQAAVGHVSYRAGE